MTSYSTLHPYLLGCSLPSLFSEALRAFYCALRACWPTCVHMEGNPYPTRATWAAFPLCCTSDTTAGTHMCFPDQQLVPSLGNKSGLCFHSWLWRQVGGWMQVGRCQTRQTWHWCELIPHVSQLMWMQQRTCREEKGTCLVSVSVSGLAGLFNGLQGLTWQNFTAEKLGGLNMATALESELGDSVLETVVHSAGD